MSFTNHSLIAVGASLGLSLTLTPAVRAFARRVGAVARPKSDRWHTRPTALLGGVAIFAAVTTVCAAAASHGPEMWVILGCSAFLFLVGLVDDYYHLKPYQKLIGQLVGAMPVIYCGMTLPWTGSPPLDVAITTFWLLGITNAVNLLDNMDGLAAGVSMIAAAFLAINFGHIGAADEALAMAVFAAALLGFLVYNSHPATIFMGDCGSLFVGFFLASSALMHHSSGRSRSFLPVLAVPVLILFIPIFDTTLVMVLRKLAGRAASQGGRDHTSHRLVALGLSERRAVWMLYGFALASGALALLVRDMDLDVSLAMIAGFTILLSLLGVHLAGVKVYEESAAPSPRDKPLVAFFVDLSYKRRVFEVLLDVNLIVLSYYTAYALVFGSVSSGEFRERFLITAPVLLVVKLGAFLTLGVYRGLWRYVSVDSLVLFFKAVVCGSAGSLTVLLFVFRFTGFSRVVFVLDGLILLVLLAGSRLSFRLFRQLVPPGPSREGKRVLIYGAGDGGVLLAREIWNNRGLRYVPVGFVDDDPLKRGKVIQGLRVLGNRDTFASVCREHAVDEILISSTRFPRDRVREIARQCEEASVAVKQMRIQIEALEEAVSRDQEAQDEDSFFESEAQAVSN